MKILRGAERNINQASLFDVDEIGACADVNYGSKEDYDAQEKLAHEKETFGFYISGHPLHKHREILETFTTPIESIDSS